MDISSLALIIVFIAIVLELANVKATIDNQKNTEEHANDKQRKENQ